MLLLLCACGVETATTLDDDTAPVTVVEAKCEPVLDDVCRPGDWVLGCYPQDTSPPCGCYVPCYAPTSVVATHGIRYTEIRENGL